MNFKDVFKIGEVFEYFYKVFQKPDPNKKTNFSLKAMHTINKISILMFMMCLIVLVYRYLSR